MKQKRKSDKKNQGRKTPAYQKVFDNRNRRVRGLWVRNRVFYAQIAVPSIHGDMKTRRVRLEGKTLAQARDELQRLRFMRQDNQMPAMVQTPRLGEYGEHYLRTQWDLGRKVAGTIQAEQGHVRFWADHLGRVRLKNITPSLIQGGLIERRVRGASKRTVNISQTVMRNVLNLAIQEGYITTLPFNGIKWNRVPQVERPLFRPEELEALCAAAMELSRNGQSFCDFMRLLCYCGARMSEALRLRWLDVDWQNEQLVIGQDGNTKGKAARRVDFNPNLAKHLKDMFARRATDGPLFLSGQRGREGQQARSYRETLIMAREASGLGEKRKESTGFNVGFHDARHHFVSYCVMSGVDYMTIARWVGHRDGGLLIGRVYGHLAREHMKIAASKVVFGCEIIDGSGPRPAVQM